MDKRNRRIMGRVLGCLLMVVLLGPGAVLGADAPARKVLIIGIDGMRADAFEQADAPNMHALMKQGAYSGKAQCESSSVSGPNWTTIMTGVHQYKHGVDANNFKSDTLKDYPDFFTYLEKHHPQWVTARLITWNDFQDKLPTGADLALYHNMSNNGDQIMTDKAVSLLSGTDPQAPQGTDVMFVYYGMVDSAGHSKGFSPQSPAYMQSIAVVDKQVGQILAALKSRATYDKEQWLILMTSDHGGSMDRNHGGGTEDRRTISFLMSGPAVVGTDFFPAPLNVDVAKTVLTYMGVPIDPSWQLDGHAVGLSASAPPKVAYGQNIVFNGDAEYDGGLPQQRSSSYDLYCSGWRDEGPQMMTILNYDTEAQSSNRLSAANVGGAEVGKHFFAGGPSASPISRIMQTIDLTAMTDEIDAGKAQMTLSALLGGWGERNDVAVVTARLHDSSGYVIATASVGPVSAEDRGKKTGLLARESTIEITPGARSVTVELMCLRHVGGKRGDANAAYADNISLVLTPRPPKPAK